MEKKIKVFILKLKCWGLKHHSSYQLLSHPANDETGKMSCPCLQLETQQVLWTVRSPPGSETTVRILPQGLTRLPISTSLPVAWAPTENKVNRRR